LGVVLSVDVQVHDLFIGSVRGRPDTFSLDFSLAWCGGVVFVGELVWFCW
jgi:hypothetical protein